jgi:hypothetical protein
MPNVVHANRGSRTVTSNLFAIDTDSKAPTYHSSLQNGGFYKPSREELIDETLFKDFGCADRWSGRRRFRSGAQPIVFVVSIPSTCPFEKIGLA